MPDPPKITLRNKVLNALAEREAGLAKIKAKYKPLSRKFLVKRGFLLFISIFH